MNKTPTTLIIMDGFGLSNDTVGNAVRAANTPVLDGLFAEYAHTTLQASGLDVGLPAGQMGNSEVGHTNIGGGRVVFQDLPRITRSIEDGTFFENPAYNKAMDDCIEKGSALHLYGLHSTGGVHSTLDHLYALLKMAHIKGLKRVYIHAFLDGRDTPPTSGRDFVAKTMEKCRELGVGKIATVMGRYYAMDRDKRWDRLENAYDALVYGEGVQDSDPIHAIEESYKNGVTDEFVEPIVCDKDGMISDNDSVIFFNYLQVAMGGPREAGTAEQYHQAGKAFFEVIEKYQPEYIIVWGKRLWNNLPNVRWHDGDDIVVDGYPVATGAYLLSNGKQVKVMAVNHPSVGYSWDYWYRVIQRFLE